MTDGFRRQPRATPEGPDDARVESERAEIVAHLDSIRAAALDCAAVGRDVFRDQPFHQAVLAGDMLVTRYFELLTGRIPLDVRKRLGRAITLDQARRARNQVAHRYWNRDGEAIWIDLTATIPAGIAALLADPFLQPRDAPASRKVAARTQPVRET